jgi:hypothetical protein
MTCRTLGCVDISVGVCVCWPMRPGPYMRPMYCLLYIPPSRVRVIQEALSSNLVTEPFFRSWELFLWSRRRLGFPLPAPSPLPSSPELPSFRCLRRPRGGHPCRSPPGPHPPLIHPPPTRVRRRRVKQEVRDLPLQLSSSFALQPAAAGLTTPPPPVDAAGLATPLRPWMRPAWALPPHLLRLLDPPHLDPLTLGAGAGGGGGSATAVGARDPLGSATPVRRHPLPLPLCFLWLRPCREETRRGAENR